MPSVFHFKHLARGTTDAVPVIHLCSPVKPHLKEIDLDHDFIFVLKSSDAIMLCWHSVRDPP